MNAIIWPEDYTPGFTDNFCSNEVIVAGLSVKDIWPLLATPSLWPSYYSNSSDTRFHDDKGPVLEADVCFFFKTFGFPIEAQVTECVAPQDGKPARLAWHGWAEGDAETRLDVIHAWLLEDLPQGRVRVLTQESQKGKPAQELAKAEPNPMINGHQQWLNGLIDAAKREKNQDSRG